MALTETPSETAAQPVATGTATPTGLAGVLGSGDHKVIGRLYLATGLLFGAVVAALGMAVAVEALEPETLEVFTGETAWQFFTLFRVGSVFLLALPLVIGIAMVVVPLQVGASSVAFPRAAAASYWGWLLGSGLLVASYAMNGGPGGGSSEGVNLWIASLGLIVLSILLAAVSLATTVFALRAPGLTLARTPMFAWSVAVAAVMWLLTLPILIGLLVLLYVDHRSAGSTVFSNAELYGRLGWLFRNPQVYVVAIPVLGFAVDVISTTAKTRIPFRGPVQAAIGALGVLSFGAFLATASIDVLEEPFVIGMGLLAVLPVLLVLVACADLLRRGTVRINSGALYAIVALLVLLLGTAAGALGSIPSLETSFTIYDLGITHAAVLAAVIASVGGIQWWATKVLGAEAKAAPGMLAPVVLLLGSVLVVAADLASGLLGDGAELAPDYTGGIELWNMVAVAGTGAVILGLLIAVSGFVPALRSKADDAPADPYEGLTLEWLTASPPALANFDDELAPVRSGEPLLDLREEDK